MISDTHFESNPLRKFPPADLYLCAGDIGSPLEKHKLVDFFGSLEAELVIWVPGNHEYHGFNLDSAKVAMREIAELAGVTLLDRDSIEYRGLKIYGATLWSLSNHPDNSDLRYIEGFDNPTRNQLHCEDLEFLLSAPDGSLIVFHHSPSYHGLNPAYQGDPRNCIYASRLERYLRKRSWTWVFGHTHHPTNFQLGQCLLFSNPVGHLLENLQPWQNPSLEIKFP